MYGDGLHDKLGFPLTPMGPDGNPVHYPRTNPGSHTPWSMLRKGKSIGKSVDVLFTTPALTQSVAPAFNDLLLVQGEDDDAMNLKLTINPPQYAPTVTVLPTSNGQQVPLSGTQDNVMASPPKLGGAALVPPFASAFASIEWGCGGASNVAEVDFNNGVTVDLTASFVRVKAAFDVFPSAEYGDPSFVHPYRLSAFIGPGYPRGSYPATRTLIGDVLNDGAESAAYAIPRFSRRAFVFAPTGLGVTFVGQLRLWRDNRGAASVFPIANYLVSGNNPGSFIIPNGAAYWTIVNNSGAQEQPRICFELGI